MAVIVNQTKFTSVAIQRGLRVVCGVPADIKPITGVPEGKMCLRLRGDAIAQLFVRTKTGTRKMLLEDKGDTWLARADMTVAQNIRRPRTAAWLPGANVSRCVRLNPKLLSRS